MKKLAFLIVVVLLIAAAVMLTIRGGAEQEEKKSTTRRTAKVLYGDLELTVEEDGELKALHSVSVGPLTSGTITFLAPEGERVRKGDVLIELDTESIEERIRNTQNDLESSQKKLADAKDSVDADAARLDLDVERKKTSLELTELALKELSGLPLPDDLALAEKTYEEAELNKSESLRSYNQIAALAKKGYATTLELEQNKMNLLKAELVLKRQGIRLERVRQGASQTAIERARFKVSAARLELEKAISVREGSLSALKQRLAWQEASFASAQKHLENLQRDLKKHRVLAPAEGTVIYREQHGRRGSSRDKFQVGNNVWTGIAVIELPDTSVMMIRTRVPERAISRVHLGKDARVRVDTLPGEEFPARITWIDHWARDANQDLSEADQKQEGLAGHQVFDIEAEIPVRDERLKPGFKGIIIIPIGRLADVIYVDKRAVHMKGGSTVVTLKNGEQRRVVTAESSGQHIVVKSGLKEGEEVFLQ